MMSTPEVSYTRPTHPDKQVRPPPKSFADFQNEAKPSLPDGTKGTYIPPKPSSPDALEFTQAEQRLGLLEQRLEAVEAELEELTDAATKPGASGSALPYIEEWARLAVMEGLVAPEIALRAIARKLGLDVSLRAPAPRAAVAAPVTRLDAPPPAAIAEPMPDPETETRRGRIRSSEQEDARQRVRALMTEHHLSQNRIAKAAGYAQTAVSRWLRGYDSKEPAFARTLEKAISKLI